MRNQSYPKLISLCTGFILIGLILYFSDVPFSVCIKSLLQINIKYFFILLSLNIFLYYFSSLRWALILSTANTIKTIPKDFFFYYTCLANFSSTFFLNTIGDASVKITSLNLEHNIPINKSSYVVIICLLLNCIILLTQAVSSIFYGFKILPSNYSFILNFIILLLVLTLFRNYHYKIFRFIKILLSHIFYIFKKLSFWKNNSNSESLFMNIAHTMDEKTAVKSIFYSFCIYYLNLLFYYTIAVSLNISISLIPFFLLYPIVFLISAIGITPSSLGVAELGWMGVLMLEGVSKEKAVIFMINQRLIGIAFVFIITLLSFIFYHLRR
ncbi:MAG: flippase-like domain-containing protein [Desulfobacterales bacterium]|nr:flippase-like domain-containing protein [Desulfobacterales bacterium]